MAGAEAADVHVFTFADAFTVMLCHLARTVEAAGGWLHVLGLRDGKEAELPWGRTSRETAATREDEPWHFADKTIMLKKHLFLFRAIRRVPANATVIFVDAFDVLFQRPLADLVATYRRLAGPLAAGERPVIFGGERNCWPFPHEQALRVPRNDGTHSLFRIPADAHLSSEHNAGLRYPYGSESPWSIPGREVCAEFLAKRGGGPLPFLCAGTFVGEALGLRRFLVRLFRLHRSTQDYHDQALAAMLLLQNSSLGLIDDHAQLFLGLHGHDEFEDLERPLCRGDVGEPYFLRSGKASGGVLAELQPPAFHGRAGRRAAGSEPASLLHFNGNGKRHMLRCVEEFKSEGLLAGDGEDEAECTFFDVDRNAWQRFR